MRFIIPLVLALFLATPVFAQGGFQGPSNAKVDTVKAAKTAYDDTLVELTGNLVQRIGKDDFLFRDSTGEIEVEIEELVFGSLTVTPETKIKIYGEVDKDQFKSPKIDVKRVEVAK